MAERVEGLVVSIAADTTQLRASLSEATKLGRGFGSALTGAFEDAAINGRKLSDVIGKLALSLSRTAVRQAVRPLGNAIGNVFGQVVTPGTGQGSTDGPFSNILGFAKGGVVSRPHSFAMHGGTGIAGEAGPEAILPLARGADGRLGVRAGGGGRAINITFNVTAGDANSFRRSQSQIATMLTRAVERGTRNL